MAVYIGIAVLVLILGLLAFISTRSGRFHVERSVHIDTPAKVVFPLINDFHNWAQWSPWDKMDPNLKRTYEGPASGPGAVYSWVGNKKIGEGRMTLEDSKQDERISIRLDFLKPFKSTNQAIFTLAPSGNGTRVTWRMEGGDNTFMCKAFSLVMNMDRMIGKDFEKGLAQIKSVAEAAPRQ